MFTTEQLALLKPSGVIGPNGLNDNRRHNFEGQPFAAVDDSMPQEVDDAVRIVPDRKTGGYILEVAIADGSQICDDTGLLNGAIEQVSNNYHPKPRYRREVLPKSVVAQLELRGRDWKRATVIRTAYDADSILVSEPEIVPAWVHVINLTFRQFAREVSGLAGNGRPKAPIAKFLEQLPNQPSYRRIPNHQFENPEDSFEYGARAIATSMIIANLAVSSWAKHENVPILYRNFDPTSETDGYVSPTMHTAAMSPSAGRHIAISSNRDTPYTFYTSPLRRASDLVTHCQVGQKLAGREPTYDTADLTRIARILNQRYPTESM